MSDHTKEESSSRGTPSKHSYPAEHWIDLRRFAEGDEKDPKGLFRLADDCWPAWKYSERGRPSNSWHYRFNFTGLRSWLKLYIKLYCYNNLIGRGGRLGGGAALLPYRFERADRFIIEHKIISPSGLMLPGVFDGLWEAQLAPPPSGGWPPGPLPQSAVEIQITTHSFWKEMRARYGVPAIVPPVARYRKKTPSELGVDESKLIPDAVIAQLVNKLALHRDGIVPLNPFNHLRLCVLILVICLGRRVEEVLGAHRGAGSDGPFKRYPCRRRGEEEAAEGLWFRFRPNKEGPSDLVYVSPEWEDLALYCVRHLVAYSDTVRDFAAPEERDLLILTSTWNWTAGAFARRALPPGGGHDFTRCGGARGGRTRPRNPHKKYLATGLSYPSFCDWLNGYYHGSGEWRWGVMQEWNVTEGGSTGDTAYRLLTGQARHTRQSEIARCPGVPLLARQRDLNHTDPGMQKYYQHVLNQENEELMSAVMKSPLRGHDMEWLKDLLCTGGVEESDDQSPYREGLVRLSTPRWRKLVESNRLYFESNAVEKGTCDTARGPSGCERYRPGKKAQVEYDSINPNGTSAGPPQRRAAKNNATALGDGEDGGPERPRDLPLSDPAGELPSVGSDGVAISDSASLVKRLRKRARQIEKDEL